MPPLQLSQVSLQLTLRLREPDRFDLQWESGAHVEEEGWTVGRGERFEHIRSEIHSDALPHMRVGRGIEFGKARGFPNSQIMLYGYILLPRLVL